MLSLRSLVAAGVVAATIAVAIAHAQSGTIERTAIVRAPAFSGRELTALPTTAWLTNGGDLFNRRYSPLTEITRDNVATLQGVWRTRLNGSGLGARYSGEAQPLVHEGVAYVITGANDVFAISLESGAILWTYEAHLDPSLSTVCCGWTSRGVALANGKVFVGQLDGNLVALDQQTGTVVWSVAAERWQDGFTITSAPLYYDGLIITGFAGAEFGLRGRVKAFDANDGHLVWTFYTIPGPGEVGHDTWPPHNDSWTRGGASVWQTPAADSELGLIYFSTGNAGPDFGGTIRAGDNLFSSSIVAVDAKTGRYRWHFQQVHHDLWDYDAPSPVVLFDLEINGRMRKAAAEPSKTGWVYILDRVTGKPLVGIEERPVPQEPRQATAKTQPFPTGDAFVPHSIPIAPEGFRLLNEGGIFTPYWTEPVVARPGQGGGANWPASSYDPATGYLYVCATDRIGVFTASENGGDRGDLKPIGQQVLGRTVRQPRLHRVRYFRGPRHAHQQAGVAAAVAGSLLQRVGDDRRRTRLRRPQRRSADCARLTRWYAPVAVSDGRGRKRAAHCLRVAGPPACARVLGGEYVRRLAARRQRLAVLAARHVAAGRCAGKPGAHDECGADTARRSLRGRAERCGQSD